MKKRILAIDDEKIVLDSITKVLGEEGFDVTTTSDAAEGIWIAVNESCDLVLTDIRMPGTDGFKVIRDIRRAGKSVPIVMITGYASVSSAVQAMKLGATNYIEKPFTPDQLVHTVYAAMDETENGSGEEAVPMLVHKKEVLKVLKKGAKDPDFAQRLYREGVDALDDFDLTGSEKLALVTRDIGWIEDQIGPVKLDIKWWLSSG